MKKRIISFLLALCLVIGLIPASAPQAEAAAFDTTGWVWPVKAVNAPAGASNRDLYCKTMYRAYYADHLAIDITDYTGYNYAVRAAKSGTVSIVYSGCANYSGASSAGASCSSAKGCYPTKNGAYHANTHSYAGKTFCNWGFGNGVVINHDNGVDSSEYAHMSSVIVSPGQYVVAGQIIGYMGSAGASTGKHLDFVIKHNGTRVNNNPIGDDVIIKNPDLWNKIDTIDYADEPNENMPVTNYLDIGDDFYARICFSSDQTRFLTDTGTEVYMAPEVFGPQQTWFFDRQADGSYLIRAFYNSKVLDVYDGSAVGGARIQTWEDNGTPAQRWYILGSEGKYKLQPACSTCVMDGGMGTIGDYYTVATYTSKDDVYSQFFDIQIENRSPKAQIIAFPNTCNPGKEVQIFWPQVLCADRYWIDIWTEDNRHPVSENLGSSIEYAFTPTEPGTYRVYVTATMVDVSYLSDPYYITVTEKGIEFKDVPKSEWYYEPVMWAVKNKITAGTSDTTFSPNDPCTRAQVVTFLYRAAGSPAVSGSSPFTDVKSTDYFHSAVLWAVQNGITQGTSATSFSPDEPCTRAQVATFLWRSKGQPIPVTIDSPFTDVPLTEYYYIPVIWAVKSGITQGTGGGKFSPDESCTRAQIVTFLHRADNG